MFPWVDVANAIKTALEVESTRCDGCFHRVKRRARDARSSPPWPDREDTQHFFLPLRRCSISLKPLARLLHRFRRVRANAIVGPRSAHNPWQRSRRGTGRFARGSAGQSRRFRRQFLTATLRIPFFQVCQYLPPSRLWDRSKIKPSRCQESSR
jgi:hypothetical protein